MIRRRKTGKSINNPITKQTKTEKPQTIVQHLQAIMDSGNEIGSLEKLMKKVPQSILAIAEYLGCTDFQATIFSLIFCANFTRSSVDLDDLSTYLSCSPINIGCRIEDFDTLINMSLIRKEPIDESRYRKLFPQGWKYHVLPDLFEPILRGTKIVAKELKVDNYYALLQDIDDTFSNRVNGIYGFDEVERDIKTLMCANEHLPLVQEIKKLELGNASLYILCYLAYRFVQGSDSIELPDMLKTIFPDLQDQIGIRKSMLTGKHELQMKDLAALEESVFRSDRMISLTECCIDLLFANDKLALEKKGENKKPGFISFHDIPDKRLFFRETEQKNLQFLENVLQPDNFKRLTLRLEEKKMPNGVAILLYGAPGTGKTESVFQIARRTGRDIHQVVISETKSKWFGDSEKLIKKVFDKYRAQTELKEIAPILLFNEADGIFSRRKESNQSSVDQTENAIQNIILQEMEDLKGILIATTNMASNLDKAFERRFLYKICFEKPSVESRFHIWRDKIPSLTDDETSRLADRFNLSGGQIENIARKCIMKEVLQGSSPSLDELYSYCNEENLQTSVQRIGFRR